MNKKLLKIMINFIKLLLFQVQNHYQITTKLNVIKKVLIIIISRIEDEFDIFEKENR